MAPMGAWGKRLQTGHRILDKIDVLDGEDLEALYRLLSEKLDIRELLDELGFERLSESGANIYGNCPVHDDRTVSWGICYERGNDKWGRHGCFSCHASGNVVSLVKDHMDGLTNYKEALFWLLKRCGLMPATEEEALDMAVRLRRRRTKEKAEQKEGPTWIKSLTPVRPGCSAWDYLVGREVTFSQIVQSGARVGTGKTYGGRVILPIVDHRGKLASFYARDITGEADPKGLYPKGAGSLAAVLYGRYLANPMERAAYLVEGVFDAWAVQRSLVRVGLPADNVFAVLRSSLSDGQAELLTPWRTIIVVPDMKGKSEGLVPSIKAKLGERELLVVEPDQGHDPDSLSNDRLDEIILTPESVYESRVRVFVSYDLPRKS